MILLREECVGREQDREEGVVLLLVLVIIVMTITSVWAFARSSALDVMGGRLRADRGRAELLARSGVEVALRALKDDLQPGTHPGSQIETREDPWFLIGETELALPDQGHLRILVRDMGGKINLNGLVDLRQEPHSRSREFLTRALRQVIRKLPGRAEDKPYDPAALADAILDWIDIDLRTRLGDPEGTYYSGRGARLGPPNRRFFSIAELGGVPGVDERMLEELRHYFTVHPVFAELRESGLNPNTAPAWMIGLIYMGSGSRRNMLEPRDVLSTLRERAEGRIFCPVSEAEPCTKFQEWIGQIGDSAFPPLAFHNRTFEIESIGRYREARACVSAVVERRGILDVRLINYEKRCH